MISPSRLIHQIRASYSAKLIVIFIAALFVMATVLNFTFIRLQKNSYRVHMRDSGLAIIRLLATSLQIDLFTENISELQNALEALQDQDNILHVDLLTDKGAILVSRSFDADRQADFPSCETLFKDIRLGSSFFREWPDSFTFWWPVLAIPEHSSEDALYFEEDTEAGDTTPSVLGYVTMVISKDQYKEEIRQIFIRTGLIILPILILLITGVSLLFRRLTQPLQSLIAKIRQERNIGEIHDDIGLLDTTVTTLVEDLDRSFQTINELTSGLEDQVAERTRQLGQANKKLTTRQEYLEEANKKLEKAMKELKEAEGQLIQSEKMAAIGQVVAGVAHEINNNINFISGALPSLDRAMADVSRLMEKFKAACTEPTDANLTEARALQKELEEDELFDSLGLLMDNIREGVNRTTRIIADLQTFSRADEQGYKTVDLHKAINSTITFLDKDPLHHIEIIKAYGELPLVSCRPDRINQVFLNIMNNALHAMATQGGTLTITTSVKDSMVHIRFGDTGTGINKETLPRIFDPFFTSKDIGEGSGIGLAISYKIIQQHGGRIEVTSDEGKGSSFEVILPVVRQDEG